MSQTLTSNAVNSTDQTWKPPLWAVIAFTVFAATVTAIDFFLVYQGPFELHEKLTSYTGLSPSTFYMFALIGLGLYLFQKEKRSLMGFGSMMVLQILFGLYHQWLYLTNDIIAPRIHPYQMLYTIALPIFWLVALFHPYIRQKFSK